MKLNILFSTVATKLIFIEKLDTSFENVLAKSWIFKSRSSANIMKNVVYGKYALRALLPYVIYGAPTKG